MKKYAVLIEIGEKDGVGELYTLRQTDTLQQAYSLWIEGGLKGEVIKVVEAEVREKS